MALWNSGMDAQQGSVLPTGLGHYYNMVGCTPFQSPYFCAAVKIMKVSKVILPQGGSHEHREKIAPNKMFI